MFLKTSKLLKQLHQKNLISILDVIPNSKCDTVKLFLVKILFFNIILSYLNFFLMVAKLPKSFIVLRNTNGKIFYICLFQKFHKQFISFTHQHIHQFLSVLFLIFFILRARSNLLQKIKLSLRNNVDIEQKSGTK